MGKDYTIGEQFYLPLIGWKTWDLITCGTKDLKVSNIGSKKHRLGQLQKSLSIEVADCQNNFLN